MAVKKQIEEGKQQQTAGALTPRKSAVVEAAQKEAKESNQ